MENKPALNPEELEQISGGVNIDTGRYINYAVVKGDTLTRIAHRYHTTVELLVRINNIKDANMIRAGQVLRIPV